MTANAHASSTFQTPIPGPWLQALVANVQDAIVILDREGRVVFESPSTSQILGIPTDDVLGTFGLSRIHPGDREAVIESFRRTIARSGAVLRATYRFQRADGEWQHLEAVAKNLLEDPELRGVLITFRDVSERVRASEAAERASRARDEYLYNVSREIRAPVEAIVACSRVPAQDPAPDGNLLLDQIRQHASHLLRLIGEASDLAGVRNGRIALDQDEVEVRSLLTEAVRTVHQDTPRKDVQLVFEPTREQLWIVGERPRLLRMLIDIVDGLVRTSRFMSQITISVDAGFECQARVKIRGGGEELSENRVNNVFDEYGRSGAADTPSARHDLGLAIAGRLTELMGGAMGIERMADGGTTVWFELPTSLSAEE